MLETLQALFAVAQFPEALISVHREPNTQHCANIESIGLNIRGVKVEAVKYDYRGAVQYLLCLHLNSGKSTVLCHNDRIVAANPDYGHALETLIRKEINAVIDARQTAVLEASIDELMAHNAIHKLDSNTSMDAMDEFILHSSAEVYTSMSEFLSARQV